uniref:Pepsin inhibitor-3-like repeated domain-containing protein n=1 Tax=Setaria digitata TaxID=48799 RepID=A0A915PT50_9BILA
MGIFGFILVMVISFELTAALPASTSSSFSVISDGFICSVVDGKIYVNNAYKGEATPENIREMKEYHEKTREWAKELHDTMYTTMKKIIDDMFGEYGSFWRSLHGPFWEAINTSGSEGNVTEATVAAPDPSEETEKPISTQFSNVIPFPEPPSFCKP